MTPAEAKAFREAEQERLLFIRQAYEQADEERSLAERETSKAILKAQSQGFISRAFADFRTGFGNWFVFLVLRICVWFHLKLNRDLGDNIKRVGL